MSLAEQSRTQSETASGDERQFRGPGWEASSSMAEERSGGSDVNVARDERWVSAASGAILALLGLGRRDRMGLFIAGVGAGLVYRGVTGHCSIYGALGVDTADDPVQTKRDLDRAAASGLHVAQSMLIDRTPEELYKFWRNFENLPRIMSHLESVQVLDEHRSRWTAKAPTIAGGKVEWEAEITEDVPNSRIAWRSLSGADVDNQGWVQFTRALGDRGTAVRVVLDYNPPAGRLGKWVAKLFGQSPDQQIWRDLRNFKRFMEIGEILTVVGQPRGSCIG